MYEIVLVIQLVICVALIGLVLLQRSEGGALGMGGGGGGSLMSGRGAADALAKFTGFAGAGFLATSLLLTVIAGASQSQLNRSVLDIAPVTQPATQTAPTPAPAPTPTTPDPLESFAPQAAETQLASASAPVTVAPPPAAAAARAAPVAAPQPRATQPTAAPRTTAPATVQPASARPATTQPARPAATTQPARPAATTQPAARQPAVTTPAPIPTESSEASGEPEAVRRERAGPDQ